MAIGDKEECQVKAADILKDDGPMEYDEFSSEVRETCDIEHEEVQTVIRGLSDNGVLESSRNESGEWEYEVREDNLDRYE